MHLAFLKITLNFFKLLRFKKLHQMLDLLKSLYLLGLSCAQKKKKRVSLLLYYLTHHPSWVTVHYCYSPRGVKERTGLVSRLLSLLASLLQPWLILGRGIRLPRANATQVTTPHRSRGKCERGNRGRKSSGGKKSCNKKTKDKEEGRKEENKKKTKRREGKVTPIDINKTEQAKVRHKREHRFTGPKGASQQTSVIS